MSDPNKEAFKIEGGEGGPDFRIQIQQAEYGEEISFGETKFQRPLNIQARHALGPVGALAFDLYDHFDGRVKALETENESLRERLGKLEGRFRSTT